MAQHRIQIYMEKHSITPLFEELMNKVLHDQPDDPLVYLIRSLYRKAGLQVPKDLKPGTLRRSSPERLPRRSRSPDKTTQAWAVASGPDLVDRSYEKPWKSNSKKIKSKKTEEQDTTSKPGRKLKQGWNPDTKVTTTTFDDLFDEDDRKEEIKVRHQREATTSDSRKAWATIGMEENEDQYRSRGYTGPRCNRQDKDPLAGEIMLSAGDESPISRETTTSVGSSHARGPKSDVVRHRQELEKLLRDSDKASLDSGYAGEIAEGDQEEDDAIELLEDPDDLRREGVTKISKDGYKISKWMRQRQEEAQVKLNINHVFVNQKGDPYPDYSYESDLERPVTGMSQQVSEYSPGISDEEFESISQVAGPRRPVWNVPDSEGEMYQPRTSKTLPEPSRSRNTQQGKLSSTLPVKFDDEPYTGRSVESDNSFLQGGKTWTAGQLEQPPPPADDTQAAATTGTVAGDSTTGVRVGVTKASLQSSRSQTDAGWVIPDDTEVSLATQWSDDQTTGRTSATKPKAY